LKKGPFSFFAVSVAKVPFFKMGSFPIIAGLQLCC
jgi:hypothetical protein